MNVTSSLGKLVANQWSPEGLPCHFQACPDVFPLSDDPTLFVVISSSLSTSSYSISRFGYALQNLAKKSW